MDQMNTGRTPQGRGIPSVALALALLLVWSCATTSVSPGGGKPWESARSEAPSGASVRFLDSDGFEVRPSQVFFYNPDKNLLMPGQMAQEGYTADETTGTNLIVLAADPLWGGVVSDSLKVPFSREFRVGPSALGSVVFEHNSGEVPGLEGSLNPIFDTSARTYVYGTPLSINRGAAQPVTFTPTSKLDVTDAKGSSKQVWIPFVRGEVSLVNYSKSTSATSKTETLSVRFETADGQAVTPAEVVSVDAALKIPTPPTRVEGESYVFEFPSGSKIQIVAADPRFSGLVTPTRASGGALVLRLDQGARGSVLAPEGTCEIPGLAGRLNPIFDTSARLYLYADNISVNSASPQPVTFNNRDALVLTDANDVKKRVWIPLMTGRMALVSYELQDENNALHAAGRTVTVSVVDPQKHALNPAQVIAFDPLLKVRLEPSDADQGRFRFTFGSAKKVVYLVADPGLPGLVTPLLDTTDQTVVVPLGEGSSVVTDHGTINLPGLRGRLNPILDTEGRTYVYADNILINGSEKGFANFTVGSPLSMLDLDGVKASVTFAWIKGDTSLVRYSFAKGTQPAPPLVR